MRGLTTRVAATLALPAGSREVAAYQAQTLLRSRRIVRFDAHSVVDGKAQFLLASSQAANRRPAHLRYWTKPLRGIRVARPVERK